MKAAKENIINWKIIIKYVYLSSVVFENGIQPIYLQIKNFYLRTSCSNHTLKFFAQVLSETSQQQLSNNEKRIQTLSRSLRDKDELLQVGEIYYDRVSISTITSGKNILCKFLDYTNVRFHLHTNITNKFHIVWCQLILSYADFIGYN